MSDTSNNVAGMAEAKGDLRIYIQHCTCAYFDQAGVAMSGTPCQYHPKGCEHGKNWDEPCMVCRDELWGKS